MYAIISELIGLIGSDELALAADEAHVDATPDDIRAKWTDMAAAHAKIEENKPNGPSATSVENKRLAKNLYEDGKAHPDSWVTLERAKKILGVSSSQKAARVINVLLDEGLIIKDDFIKVPIVYRWTPDAFTSDSAED